MTLSSASTSDRPIGVFDSGVGGLSVLRAIRDELPAESILYAGDSGFAPYGDKPEEFVRERATAILEFLTNEGSKAIVVACNTVTGMAIEALRKRFGVPIIAIEPAVKPAAARTKTGVVGVLATTGTVASPNLSRLVNSYGMDVRFLIQPSPGLADQVEKGELMSQRTRELVRQYVRPLIDQGADTLVLGCTHYPFLRDLIQEVAGAHVELIDPAHAVARELKRRLEKEGLLCNGSAPAARKYWTTGDPQQAAGVMSELLGEPVSVERL